MPMHHRRKRAKHQRAGCLLCKPHGGILNHVRRADHDAAFVLLSTITLERAQTMALELWQLTGKYSQSDRAFIEGSDRSICVLLQKATVIEREVVRLRLDGPPEDPADELWREIIDTWIRYCHCGHSVAQWLVPFRFSDVDGVLNVWAPTKNVRDSITRFGFEEPLERAVEEVLGPRRIVFTCGEDEAQERTG
jgi:hypothetical protein